MLGYRAVALVLNNLGAVSSGALHSQSIAPCRLLLLDDTLLWCTYSYW